ncbi:hypothetical protein [Streptococcus suis]|uniref:hypothetical protein n=1 Tax=Streptococcus suis TaxID=1307 RepID=UPI001CF13DE8|nr:hypothetical protein [Streptococcus suis]MCB2884353.1 hypothetical protein [Streptococcus suis]MCB2892318.1 hypothetical protein [Streptococcus suis]MCB2911120.1 hypothetical protein [Streptococcus suis]MCB2913236.1 hypothetical protein [Streptococcus suis]MCQ8256024.1 hypothetical protein [Streptococcus suis]
MTNEKLGVLLIDVPEPRMAKYSVLVRTDGKHRILDTDSELFVRAYGCCCTQEEAKKYPQFRWVALEELE